MHKKYQIIYIDVPWQYRDSRKSGGKTYFGAAAQYSTMSFEQLSKLPIANMAAKDCVMFMWATSPMLADAMKLINIWGFSYKTVGFVWSKRTKNGKLVSNLGQWTNGNVEICLVATKGKPKRIRKDVKQLVIAERTKHSKKPSIIRDRIVDLMGDLPRIELFATEKVPGWDAVGLEIGIDIIDFLKTYERSLNA